MWERWYGKGSVHHILASRHSASADSPFGIGLYGREQMRTYHVLGRGANGERGASRVSVAGECIGWVGVGGWRGYRPPPIVGTLEPLSPKLEQAQAEPIYASNHRGRGDWKLLEARAEPIPLSSHHGHGD